jgi:hypothetical protein
MSGHMLHIKPPAAHLGRHVARLWCCCLLACTPRVLLCVLSRVWQCRDACMQVGLWHVAGMGGHPVTLFPEGAPADLGVVIQQSALAGKLDGTAFPCDYWLAMREVACVCTRALCWFRCD